MKFARADAQLTAESVNMNRIMEKVSRRVVDFRPALLLICEKQKNYSKIHSAHRVLCVKKAMIKTYMPMELVV